MRCTFPLSYAKKAVKSAKSVIFVIITVIMKSTLRAYLTGLKQMSSNALSQPCTYFKKSGHDFTRRRALYLDPVVWLKVGSLKCTLNIEIYHFFDSINKQEVVPT
jgi:hypothetical protein